MGFTRISNASLNSRGATTLPNQPQISAAALKQEFDAPAKNIVAPAVNNLMDELEASSGAGNIGAVAPTGRTGATVQTVINSVSGDLATLEVAAEPAIADAHTHSNKSLLDTYTQTETDLADAVSKKHDHSNKSLLDTYTQTETDLADAVSKKHAHTNLALLETYTQTESDLAQAVADDHTHTNKTVIDKFGEDSQGKPTYDGNPIGGGGGGAVDSVNGQTGTVVLDQSDINDVTITSLADQHTLVYNANSSIWENEKLADVALSGLYGDLTNQPTDLADFADDTTHRLVTDAEKTAWNAKVSESLLKDTVGWVGKNKLNITSVTESMNSGKLVFTVYRNGNGEVIRVNVNGVNDTAGVLDFNLIDNSSTRKSAVELGYEANKQYIISGCNGGSSSTYFLFFNGASANKFTCYDGEVTDSFSANDTYRPCIRVIAGVTVNNVDFYPMLRDASITDSTFEPYHKSVSDVITDVYGVMGENGAKNKSPVPYSTASGTERNGVTLNYDADGVITLSGTASQITEFTLVSTTDLNNLRSKYGDLIVNGCDEGSTSSYFLYLGVGGATKFITSSNKEVLVNDTVSYSLVLQVKPDAGDVTGKKLYPMLRDARDTNSAYQPYAMTNRELTESVQGDNDELTLSFSESSSVTLRIRKLIDDIVVISANAGSGSSGLSISWVTVENFIPIKYRPSRPVYADMHIGPNAYLRFNILSDGTLKYLCTSNSTVYIQGTTMYVRS